MKTELIQASSNANINSDSAEIIASECISYLYFSTVVVSIVLAIFMCWSFLLIKSLLASIKQS